VEAEELLEHQGHLVGSALGRRRDAPVVDELAIGEQADHRLGVAAVDGQQHVASSQPASPATLPRMGAEMSKAMSSAGADWVITLVDTKSAPASA
jgi:hypothetical protein